MNRTLTDSLPWMRMIAFARGNRLPFTWRDPERADDRAAAALVRGLDEASLPLVRLPVFSRILPASWAC